MTIFNPTVTEVGQAAAFNADNTGTELVITHIAFGLGTYDPTGAETALVNEVERVPVASGARITPTQIRMNGVWSDPLASAAIGEIGIYADDILFAVLSRSSGGVIGHKTPGVDFVFNYSMLLTVVPAGSVTVVEDTGTSAVLAALMLHEGAEDPHPQYMMRRRRIWAGEAGGTADALELTIPAPDAFAAFEDGQGFVFVAAANNTGAVTVEVVGVDTLDLKKQGGVALDANDLQVGAIYEAMYDGTNLQLISGNGGGSASATFSTTEEVATAAQDTFSVTYTVGNLMVLIDGEQLPPSEYTATNGTSVILDTPLAGGEIFMAIAFSAFSVANVVDLSNNQSVSGIKTFVSSPVVPTLSGADSTTKVANTATVQAAITARAATTAAAGIARLANNTTDVSAVGTGGGSGDIAVTPAAMAAVVSTSSARGLIEIATNAEAQAMTDTGRAVVPANLAALRASVAEVVAGTSEQRFLTPKVLKDMRSQPAGQLINTTYDSYLFAHGFGSRPSRVDFFLECMSAEGGYSVGDWLPMPMHMVYDTGSSIFGYSIKLDATYITLSIDTNHSIRMHEWNDDGGFDMSRANKWKAHFIAYK